MLLPTDLLPEKLGLAWGMQFDPPQPPDISGGNNGELWSLVTRPINGVEYRVALYFDDQGLGCISCMTHRSRDFWDDRDGMEEIEEEYIAICQRLVAVTVVVLGPPDLALPEYCIDKETKEILGKDIDDLLFDTPQNSLIYEKWHSGMDGPEAIWMRKEARFQIGLMKEDTELPYMITVSAMRGNGRS